MRCPKPFVQQRVSRPGQQRGDTMQDTIEAESRRLEPASTLLEDSHSIVSLTTLATIVVVCGILYFAKDLFLPLALGMLFAFILSPLVTKLRSLGADIERIQ